MSGFLVLAVLVNVSSLVLIVWTVRERRRLERVREQLRSSRYVSVLDDEALDEAYDRLRDRGVS